MVDGRVHEVGMVAEVDVAEHEIGIVGTCQGRQGDGPLNRDEVIGVVGVRIQEEGHGADHLVACVRRDDTPVTEVGTVALGRSQHVLVRELLAFGIGAASVSTDIVSSFVIAHEAAITRVFVGTRAGDLRTGVGEGLALVFCHHPEEAVDLTEFLGDIREHAVAVVLRIAYIHRVAAVETDGVDLTVVQSRRVASVDVIEVIVGITDADPVGGGVLHIESVGCRAHCFGTVLAEDGVYLINLHVGDEVAAVAHINTSVDVSDGVLHRIEILRDVALSGEPQVDVVEDEGVATLYRLQ